MCNECGIKLINLNHCKDKGLLIDLNYFIYIGRWHKLFNASILANPYKISKAITREQAIELYRKWLWQHIKAKTHVFDELIRILRLKKESQVTLMCWCHPLACHGDVIIKAIEWLEKNGYE